MFSRSETLKKARELLNLFINRDNDSIRLTQPLMSVLNHLDARTPEDMAALRNEIKSWIKNYPQTAARTIDNVSLHDALHAFLIAMAAEKPINVEDPATQEVVTESERIVPLEAAYKKYLANFDPWTAVQCRSFWWHVIGFLQAMMPRFWIQEIFCHPTRDNRQTPHYSGEKELNRSTSLSNGELIYPLHGLGVNYGLSRGIGCLGAAEIGLASNTICDLQALCELSKVATEKFTEINQLLVRQNVPTVKPG